MIKIVVRSIAVFIALILLAWGVVVGMIATPEVITPHIVKILQDHTKSEVSIKSVDLSLFVRFPNLTLKIDSLRITQTKDSIDDLLFVRECRVAINPIELLKNKNLAINHLSMRDACIYLYVDSLNGPIKTFYLPEVTEDVEEEATTMDLSEYTLSLRRLKIDSTRIVIDDRVKQFYTRVENFGIDMSMKMSSAQSDLDVATGFSNLIVWREGDLLVKKTSMDLRSEMVFDHQSRSLNFDKARIHLNNIDLKARGSIDPDSLSGGVVVDIRSSLNTPSISEFLALIPTSIIDGKEKITTEGEVAFDIELKGLYSDNSFPQVEAALKINNAKAKYESRKVELERVDCDTYMFVDLNEPKSSYIDIRSLHINTSNILDLNIAGRVTDIIEDPVVDLSIASEFDLDRFTEVFPLNEGVIFSGTNSSNLKTQFRVADLQDSKYADIYIDGESIFNNLEVSLDASKFSQDTTSMAYLYMQAERGKMLFGDNIIAESNSRTLRSTANFSDLNYRSKTGEYLSIKDIDLSVGANFDRTTSLVNGIGIRGIARDTNIGIDSLLQAGLESADITFIVKPKTEAHDASINAIISSQHIEVDEMSYNSAINLSAVDINLLIDRFKEEDSQISASINSQTIAVFEPTYNSQIDLSRVDLDLTLNRLEKRRWSIAGNAAFAEFGMLSDIFPINVSIPETSVSIADKTVFLNNAHIIMGGSDMVATGNINNLIRKLLIEPRSEISGELAINASTLDIGELIEASNNSLLLEELEEAEEVVVVEEVERESRRGGRGEEMEESAMFIVPQRMDFVFDLNVDKVIYGDASIEDLDGKATLKDGVLSLDKLSLRTIGAEANGSLTYRNINRRSSNIAANMSLKDVHIDRIGELLPSVNTMLPMIESFEGVVDFDIKANTNIDSDSQVDISTLYSAMRFKGRDLVLMDSETFDDLSKSLMFKNKDRNLIDSVEVFALVAESKVDVLPFSISIDRYSAIIGGSQNIDPESFNVDYDYHISIMKSPLPFKAGVDISGDLEDFKFKVTKAKLKKTDFDLQRTTYDDYGASIDTSEAELIEELESRRKTMREKRESQRSDEDQRAKKIEKELESEPEPEDPTEMAES